MPDTLSRQRKSAKALLKSARSGDAEALARLRAHLPDVTEPKLADALHAVAREAGHGSWPRFKLAMEIAAMSRDERAERLKRALYLGQRAAIERLLAEDPELVHHNIGLEVATYDLGAVARRLARDAGAATRPLGPRTPILHLAFSRYIHMAPERRGDMLAVAELLVARGADVNDGFPPAPGSEHRLSALYGAIGHADNMALARWLLDHGADPNDNESLYHATELGHHEGLEMLIAHGAKPAGTNALLRALDFDDPVAVRRLLEAGADPNEGFVAHPSGQPMGSVPALHQAARRLCSGAVVDLLLAYGADPTLRYAGLTPYAMARIYGNRAVAQALEAAGAAGPLDPIEAVLARAADDTLRPGDRVDVAALPDELQRLLTRLVWREGSLAHIQRLVAMGFDPDVTDEMGMPPLHLAAWEGMPGKMAWLMTLSPDLDHVNGYGGTLFSTVLHGSEHCPQRARRDHIGCMRIALEAGAPMPRPAIEGAAEPEMAAFLEGWAEAHPDRVVADGVW